MQTDAETSVSKAIRPEEGNRFRIWHWAGRMPTLVLALFTGFVLGVIVAPHLQNSDGQDGVIVPPTTDLMALLVESGATAVSVESDETLGAGVMTQTRVVRFQASWDGEDTFVVFQAHPVPFRQGPEKNLDGTTTELNDLTLNSRVQGDMQQVVTTCRGLTVNVVAPAANEDSPNGMAYEFVTSILEELSCL